MVYQYFGPDHARIGAMREWLDERADITPKLVAFRVYGQAVTYEELADAIDRHVDVAEQHGLSLEAGVTAALLHCAPGLICGSDPKRTADRLDGIIAWLSRHLDDHNDLQAIG